ncbi:hypothetical protein V6N13_020140 [Hibiscus sabdariffa]|uniref:Transmembrane protein n=1 Tax=Hibiscus sabdariffa TaxID=183260 RepID=A0ABR2ET15_9ROSI
MRSEGPSPLVPSLMVGVLGLVIVGPTLLSVMEYVMPLFEAGDPESGNFYAVMLLVLLLLLILVQLLSTFYPTSPIVYVQQTGGSAGFDDGFGFGTLLFVLMFLVLFYFWSD